MFRREFLSALPGFSFLPFLNFKKEEKSDLQVKLEGKTLFIKNNEVFKAIDEKGGVFYYLNGKLHRENGPAIEYADGDKYWYLNGKLHREDGPAIEHANGNKHWFLNGKHHRENGPATEYEDGSKYYYLNGVLSNN